MSIRLVLALALCNMASLRAGRVLFALWALSLEATPITVGMLAALFALFPELLVVPKNCCRQLRIESAIVSVFVAAPV